jgi:hypothetical protein
MNSYAGLVRVKGDPDAARQLYLELREAAAEHGN